MNLWQVSVGQYVDDTWGLVYTNRYAKLPT